MLTRIAIASVFVALGLLCSNVRAQSCDHCTADANPAFIDSGAVTSCSGVVQMRMTITPTDGACELDQYGYCNQIQACDFFVLVEYRARSCNPNSETFGKTGCGTLFFFLTSYPPSSPAWSTVTSGHVTRDCDTQCVLTFFGQCTGCANGPSISSTLTCSPCQ